jgi:hypothetical protein
MSKYTPPTHRVRDGYVRGLRLAFVASAGEHVEEFDRWLADVLSAAWDKGHKTRHRRGPDKCRCSARSAGECGCGRYGTGELLSLKDNPYRGDLP